MDPQRSWTRSSTPSRAATSAPSFRGAAHASEATASGRRTVDLPHKPLRHDHPVSLKADLERLAEDGDFSGVVGLSRNGERLVDLARGLADRANGRPIRLDTRFGIASATKGLTALTVASLIESGPTPLRNDPAKPAAGRSPDGRPDGHHRAPPRPHVGRRGLPRRGHPRRRRRLRHGLAGSPPGQPRGLPAPPRRPPTAICARAAASPTTTAAM